MLLYLEEKNLTLPEKCPNTEFFLARIFPHSDWIRRNTSYLFVFSPNTGKYGPEKTPYLDTFHAVWAACKKGEKFNLTFFILTHAYLIFTEFSETLCPLRRASLFIEYSRINVHLCSLTNGFKKIIISFHKSSFLDPLQTINLVETR